MTRVPLLLQVGWTVLASSISSQEAVELLNEMYSLFDRVLDSYPGAYRVEIIGVSGRAGGRLIGRGVLEGSHTVPRRLQDAYMVAVGAPTKMDAEKQVDVAARIGLDLIKATNTCVLRSSPLRPQGRSLTSACCSPADSRSHTQTSR